MAEVTDLTEKMESLKDADFTVEELEPPVSSAATKLTPVTDKHVTWLTEEFRNGRTDFRTLRKESKCIAGDDVKDFTSEGTPKGHRLHTPQIKSVFAAWSAEKAKREAPPAPEPEPEPIPE